MQTEIHPDDQALYATLKEKCSQAPRLGSGSYGVQRHPETGVFQADPQIGCCAVGAAMLGLPGDCFIYEGFEAHYHCPVQQRQGIQDGFDGGYPSVPALPEDQGLYERGYALGAQLRKDFGVGE